MNIGSNRTFRKMKWQSRDELYAKDGVYRKLCDMQKTT